MRPGGRPYILLTTLCMAGAYWLSSRPDLGATESSRLVRAASNLAHVPMFAALGCCLLKSLSPAEEPPAWKYGVAFAATATWAVLDEWHQSFVPGRSASIGDLCLDFIGAFVVLALVRIKTLNRMRPVHHS